MIAENTWSSVVAFTQDLRDRLINEGVLKAPQYVEWDAHASINDLPQTDLIGLTAFALLAEENVVQVNCSIGVATFNEKNLFRLRKAAAIVFESLISGKTIPYLDANSGVVTNQLVIAGGTNLMPVARADVRSIQFVQFEALLEMQ
jgi:hypothetical protein